MTIDKSKLLGKTIADVDDKCVNVLIIRFTDGSAIELDTERVMDGLHEIIVRNHTDPDQENKSKCKCGQPGTEELHSCPFSEEINNNFKARCNCCRACVHECCMDI